MSNIQGQSRIHLRGLASLDPERRRQIASQGGKAAHRNGTAHEFTSEEAALAGRKGSMKRWLGKETVTGRLRAMALGDSLTLTQAQGKTHRPQFYTLLKPLRFSVRSEGDAVLVTRVE